MTGIIPRIRALLEPTLFLLFAVYGFAVAPFQFILEGQPGSLLSIAKVKDRAFRNLWSLITMIMKGNEQSTPIPGLASSASGVVLELGPGSGNQVQWFDKSKVTKIYGIEPNADLHPELRENVKKAGLEGVYEILPVGIEHPLPELERYGLTTGSLDAVVSIHVMCSIKDQAKTFKDLYRMLKPGGQLIMYEHVRSQDHIAARIQDFYNIPWPHVMGNCQLIHDTTKNAKEAGVWSKVEVQRLKEQEATVLAHSYGKLIK